MPISFTQLQTSFSVCPAASSARISGQAWRTWPAFVRGFFRASARRRARSSSSEDLFGIRPIVQPRFRRFHRKYPNDFGMFQFLSQPTPGFRKVSACFRKFQFGWSDSPVKGNGELVVEHKGSGTRRERFFVQALFVLNQFARASFFVRRVPAGTRAVFDDFSASRPSRFSAERPLVLSGPRCHSAQSGSRKR